MTPDEFLLSRAEDDSATLKVIKGQDEESKVDSLENDEVKDNEEKESLRWRIIHAIVGSKGVFDEVGEGGGMECHEVDRDLRDRFSITNEEAFNVADLACYLEWIMGGNPLDMEWTFDGKGNLFVLQTRPITSLNDPIGTLHTSHPFKSLHDLAGDLQEKKEDAKISSPSWDTLWSNLVRHDPSFAKYVSEWDTPNGLPPQWVTTYNIGEMLPGSVTPLTLSTFGRALDFGLQDLYYLGGGIAWPSRMRHCDRMVSCRVRDLISFFRSPHFSLTFLQLNHLHINLTCLGAQHVHLAIGDKRGSDASLAGRVLEEITLDHLNAYHKQDQGTLQRILNSLAFLNMLWMSRRRMKNLESLCSEHRERKNSLHFVEIAIAKGLTAAEFYEMIDDNLDILHAVWRDTIHYSAQSGVWNTLLMKVLAIEEKEWTSAHFSDVASLLSRCEDVYSAGIATGIGDLGKMIRLEKGVDEFLRASPTVALQWITSDDRTPEIRDKFNESRFFSSFLQWSY